MYNFLGFGSYQMLNADRYL
jgi:hypothetical protein